ARECVQAAVQQSTAPANPMAGPFSVICGVFVTLHVKQKLRGGIGIIEATEPLAASIAHCAAGAALHDPRFSPVRADEVDSLQIEISLLSPPFPIREEQIEIPPHRWTLAQYEKRGRLLARVATEHALDQETFLAETCRKAGLSRDAWRTEEVEIFGFTCEVFSDERDAGNGK